MKLTRTQLQGIMWALVAFAVVTSLTVWGQGLHWRFDRVTAYKLFPLFGLLAFGLMWGHYEVSALRRLSGLTREITKEYLTNTSYVVLVLILLHPGLLIYQLWNDGLGLPPGSYLQHYVAPSLKWAALLGSLSLVLFLLYELHRWYGQKPWWHYVQYATDIAMLAILVHGFKLGSNLQSGWFQLIWFFYAVTLLVALGIIYSGAYRDK